MEVHSDEAGSIYSGKKFLGALIMVSANMSDHSCWTPRQFAFFSADSAAVHNASCL